MIILYHIFNVKSPGKIAKFYITFLVNLSKLKVPLRTCRWSWIPAFHTGDLLCRPRRLPRRYLWHTRSYSRRARMTETTRSYLCIPSLLPIRSISLWFPLSFLQLYYTTLFRKKQPGFWNFFNFFFQPCLGGVRGLLYLMYILYPQTKEKATR